MSTDTVTAPAAPAATPLTWGFARVTTGVLAALAAGGGLVAYSFHLGATGGSSPAMFGFFWVGMLTALLPLVVAGTHRSAAPWQRILTLAGVAAVTTFPKILRSPSGPLFHDEYAHMRQVTDLLTFGTAPEFNSRVIPAPYYPGLHHLTAWIADLTTLTAWQASLIVISLAHIGGLIAVYALARALGLTSRGATVAGLVYATNANWMYFHSQFAYESLGLPLMLAVLATLAWIVPRTTRTTLWVVLPAAAAAGYLTATVHHLSALGLLAIVGAMTLSTTFLSRSAILITTMWASLTALTVGVALRLVNTTTLLTDYLGSPVNDGVNQLQDITQQLLGTSDSTSTDAVTLFGSAIIPGYERVAGFLVPIILAVAVAMYALIWVWQRRVPNPDLRIPDGSPMRAGVLWFGMLYFASLPLMFSPDANEGGRRSWGYTMIGLAILIGVLVDTFSSTRAPLTRRIREKLDINVAIAAILAWIVLLVGGVASGVNAIYRFPLPLTGVSDLTASTQETRALGDWFTRNVPADTWVLADRYSSIILAGQSRMRVPAASVAFPYWELYFSPEPPPLRTLAQVHALGAEYLVVDKRMADVTPLNGWWLGEGEPRPADGIPSATPASLAKFDALPWLTPVYGSQNYTVYRIDLSRYNPYETDALIHGGIQ